MDYNAILDQVGYPPEYNREKAIEAMKLATQHQPAPHDLPKVYTMRLHETITISDGFYATRVPGGWIYEIQKPQVNLLEIVFVPFDNDFMEKNQSI